MRKLTCKRCGHTWWYKGKNPYWATCPFCKTMVRVTPKGRGIKKRQSR